jgi:hypothetical protein
MARGALARIATTVAGAALAIYGVLAAVSPFPAGLPLLILGLIMIAAANPAARPFIRKLRRRWGWFDKLVGAVGKRGSERIRSVIAETDPTPESNEDAPSKGVREPIRDGL